uniref:hypothetical protein n=1 Tax=Segatella copri TaxID=165179 RepID=UPI003FED55CC
SEPPLFTAHTPSVYRGFSRFGEEGRVKARVVFLQIVQLNFISRRIVLCLAMAQSCPGKGQYLAITRQ